MTEKLSLFNQFLKQIVDKAYIKGCIDTIDDIELNGLKEAKDRIKVK